MNRLQSRNVWSWTALACGAFAALLGAVAMVGWGSGPRVLASIRMDYIPMAPNTALLFVLVGGALFAGAAWPTNQRVRHSAVVAALLSMFIGAATFMGFVTGHDFGIDQWLIHTTEMLGAVSVGRMSPITAVSFLLAGAALPFLWRQARQVTAILAVVIVKVRLR